MGGNCDLCLTSVTHYSRGEHGPSEQERHELFHQPCPTCSAVDSQADLLCDHCHHLRLRHLVRCVDPETRSKFLFPLRRGLEDSVRTECPFCRLINHLIMVGLNDDQISEVRAADCDIVLYPGLPQDSQPDSSVFSAEIWAHCPEDDGVATIWAGDLHIDVESSPTASPVGEMVSLASLMGGINECYETHKECQQKCSLPPGFRVIDVHKRCLVEKRDCRFVALSYVWGSNPQPALLAGTRAEIDEMKSYGGLPASRMPKTIEDAIDICIRMGERYLWADRLCIIQDDPEDKKHQIKAMGDIYSSAQIVLVAAYGDNMEFGIPGIRTPRKIVQHSENFLGLRITNLIRDVKDDPLDLWATRGWTYQEAVLSNRRLYFTDNRAFFECERSICHEDQFNSEESRNELFSTRLIIPEDRSRFQSFARHIRHYTSRNLTYRSDAHNALYGISSSLYKEADAFVNGLPVADFDRALLWYPDIGKNMITRHEAQGEILPSWSWLSVMGLTDPVHYRASEFYGSLVPWFQINGHKTSTGTMEAFNIHPGTNPDSGWQVYMAIAIAEGCVSASLDFSLTTKTFPAVHDKFNARWPDYHSFRRDLIPLTIKTSELPHDTPTHAAKQGVIATRSQTALLKVSPRSSSSFHIINPAGDIIGGLCGDAAKLRDAVSSGYNSSTEFEFIALSLSGTRPYPDYSGDLAQKRFSDSDGNYLDKIPVVNVLIIDSVGELSHRRELGWIYLIDWVRLRREWKVIVLG